MELFQSVGGIPYRTAKVTQSSRCRLFFRCLDPAGIFTDAVSGAVWTHPTLAYDSALLAPYTTLLNRDLSTNLQSGELNGYLGDKNMLVIVAGRVMGAYTGTGGINTSGKEELRFAMGGPAASEGVYLAPHQPSDSPTSPMHARLGPNSSVITRTGTAGSNAVLDGVDFIWVEKYIPGSGITKLSALDMAGNVLLDAPTLTGATTFTGSGAKFTLMRFGGMKMYGCAIYEMSAFPSDVDAGVLWSANAWKSGHRFLYPNSAWL